MSGEGYIGCSFHLRAAFLSFLSFLPSFLLFAPGPIDSRGVHARTIFDVYFFVGAEGQNVGWQQVNVCSMFFQLPAGKVGFVSGKKNPSPWCGAAESCWNESVHANYLLLICFTAFGIGESSAIQVRAALMKHGLLS